MNHYLFEGLDRYMKDLKDENNKKVKKIIENITSETTEIVFKNLNDLDYSFADEGRFIFDFNDGRHLDINLDMEDSETYGPDAVIEEIKKSMDKNGKITFTDFGTKDKYSISDPAFVSTMIEDIQENFEDWDDDSDFDESLNKSTNNLKEALGKKKLIAFDHFNPGDLYLINNLTKNQFNKLQDKFENSYTWYSDDISNLKGLWIIGNNDEDFIYYEGTDENGHSFKSPEEWDKDFYNQLLSDAENNPDEEELVAYIEGSFTEEVYVDRDEIEEYKNHITDMVYNSYADNDSGYALYFVNFTPSGAKEIPGYDSPNIISYNEFLDYFGNENEYDESEDEYDESLNEDIDLENNFKKAKKFIKCMSRAKEFIKALKNIPEIEHDYTEGPYISSQFEEPELLIHFFIKGDADDGHSFYIHFEDPNSYFIEDNGADIQEEFSTIDDAINYIKDYIKEYNGEYTNEFLNEDTVKRNGKWVNVGKDGKANSGKFKTKKEADAQRKAMFANGYKGESLKEETNMDKINRYLKSINEKPITEAKEEKEPTNMEMIHALIDGKSIPFRKKEIENPQESNPEPLPIRDKNGRTNMDKIHSILGESKSRSTRNMNLYENINKGFEKLYGDLDDNKINKSFKQPLREGTSNKDNNKSKKYPIKDFLISHLKDVSAILNNRSMSERDMKKAIVDLLRSSDIPSTQVDKFENELTSSRNWKSLIGTYLTSLRVSSPSKSKNESRETHKKPLKEYKDLGQDLGEYQKYVDADMEKHGHISKKTMDEIKKAGLSVVKDQYGEYEVIAKEKDHLAKSKNESRKPVPKKKSREEIVEAYRRNLRKRKLVEAIARKRREKKK